MGKLLKIRKPKLRVTKNGLKLSTPSARIGGKAGVNISKRGVSASVRTPVGTINTGKLNSKKPTKKKKPGCSAILLIIFFILLTLIIVAL